MKYLNGGRKSFFGSFGLIGCHDNQIVQRLGFSIQWFGCEYGTILWDLELLVLISSTDAVHQSSIIPCKYKNQLVYIEQQQPYLIKIDQIFYFIWMN